MRHRPLYREILHDAWLMAWRSPLAWTLAIGAGWLQTGGLVDVISRSFQRYLQQPPSARGSLFLERVVAVILSPSTALEQSLMVLRLGQMLLLMIVLVIAVVALTVTCQGALVYMLGVRGRFTKPTLREGLAVGGRHVWSILTLNLLPIGAYALAWFALIAPFQTLVAINTTAAVVAYVLAVIGAVLISFVAVAVHMLAMQSVVLEDVPLVQAIQLAWRMIKTSWLQLVEMALALAALSAALFIVSLVGLVVIVLPILALAGVAIVYQMPLLAEVLVLVCQAILILVMLAVGGFTIAWQYAAWNRLYSRLKRGQAVAKIVRLVHRALDRLHA